MNRLAVLVALGSIHLAFAEEPPNHRRPTNEAEMRYWLDNMVRHHRFTRDEVSAATGLSADEITDALTRWRIGPDPRPEVKRGDPLRVLPYPGGRHPRIGFLDGAIRPQRETKISVFTPWDPDSYVVVDVPEAIWSHLGLTYLAHTHVPTIWTNQHLDLPRLEWDRRGDGTLFIERRLPNGIAFAVTITPRPDEVEMEMSLTNGTREPLSDLRVQMCAMLKGAAGFTAQTNENKLLASPYAAARSADGGRWIIQAWEPCHRAWANPSCPCLHSDPKFPDCAPGQTVRVRGRLWFYQGDDVRAEFERRDRSGWRSAK